MLSGPWNCHVRNVELVVSRACSWSINACWSAASYSATGIAPVGNERCSNHHWLGRALIHRDESSLRGGLERLSGATWRATSAPPTMTTAAAATHTLVAGRIA